MASLKSNIQQSLKRAHLLGRLRESCLYDLYWKFADPRVVEKKNREVQFYRDLLAGFPPGGLIFDIGANRGVKTGIFLKLGARVVAVDPDDSNQNVLREKFLDYRLFKKPVTIVGKAVSDKNGVDTFFVDEPGSAKNTLNHKWVEILQQDDKRFGKNLHFDNRKEVVTITLDDLIKTHGEPYFVKIDVEGHEPSVLAGLKRPVPFLSFEVNLPEFRAEGLKCIELLGAVAPTGKFNYADDQLKLVSPQWLSVDEFRRVFEQCNDESIEIIWKTESQGAR
ncbi:MAG TPA: FkbM family methyltransferase [Verrucomicrobiae bacterium]|jgi:FkbM family methyltransferase|nr:FkbM family methyltransferase [Verrucomicrobiae bacterium]